MFFGTGTGLQEHGHKNPEKDVAAKHEGEADSVGHHHSLDPYHSTLCLSWLQLREVMVFFSITIYL